MFTTFNMGWGLGLIIDNADKDVALDVLEKSSFKPELIGKATSKERIVEIRHQNKHLIFT